jgi:hypothetical protein
VTAQGAYDVDGVIDDAGAGVDDYGVAAIVAALIAVGDWRQFNDHLRRHGAEALLPAGRQDSITVVLFAQARRKVAWAVVVADEAVVVLVAEVALVLMLVVAVGVTVAVIVVAVIITMFSVVSMPVVVVVSMPIAVVVVPVLRRGVGGWEREGCCGRADEQSKLASIQDVSFGEELCCAVLSLWLHSPGLRMP